MSESRQEDWPQNHARNNRNNWDIILYQHIANTCKKQRNQCIAHLIVLTVAANKPSTRIKAPINRPLIRVTLIITSSDGNYVTDVDNNRLLDGVGGLWNVNIGHNRVEVKAAINKQMDELAYYQMFDGIAHPRVYDLAD
ncbi:aminotransferase class III-fold pyridoxal phosphate-dependent enzyme [Amphritea sp. ZJ14W]|uniref:Aminotransferase class III-fold pyridoxal phosphate-dependent enzyme n=1 Tax=Amphritea pacifica TaxID=2811233 RepID=A0ABS2W9C3_9GAMM|nr:aminotransferase class III-fold pyridoxal phosphate-dependent enzyme [Amphritea pacifica]MBN1005565.1 aminotransferase class III-fold pyridoxal phosphate-dependent enzyme [Amphritea pacifica]